MTASDTYHEYGRDDEDANDDGDGNDDTAYIGVVAAIPVIVTAYCKLVPHGGGLSFPCVCDFQVSLTQLQLIRFCHRPATNINAMFHEMDNNDFDVDMFLLYKELGPGAPNCKEGLV